MQTRPVKHLQRAQQSQQTTRKLDFVRLPPRAWFSVFSSAQQILGETHAFVVLSSWNEEPWALELPLAPLVVPPPAPSLVPLPCLPRQPAWRHLCGRRWHAEISERWISERWISERQFSERRSSERWIWAFYSVLV